MYKTPCEICFRPSKTLLINGVKICAGCKSAYYRHNQKLLIFLLVNINESSDTGENLNAINEWSNITDIIHRFLIENYSCSLNENYINSANCTTVGNMKCKGCKLMKIVLKLRKFPSNLDRFGWDIQQLIDVNKEIIFDDLVARFGSFDAAEPENVNRRCDHKSELVKIPPNTGYTQTSIIDYICKSLNNSDKHFVFRNPLENEPMIFLDNSFPLGDRRSLDQHQNKVAFHKNTKIRNQWHRLWSDELGEQYNTCMNSTKQITALVLKELFDGCGLPDTYFSRLVKMLSPTLTTLRLFTSLDSKNRFRMAPEGVLCVTPTNFYSIMVLMYGLDQGTVVLKGCLRLGETLRNYSFYKIVLLNVYLAVSMCDSSEVDLGGLEYHLKESELRNMELRLSERKEILMIDIKMITETLGVKSEFDGVLSALRSYSDVFGVKISMLD